MAKKKAKQKRINKPGAGRPKKYDEPMVARSFRLPESIDNMLETLGPSRNAALIDIVKNSVQYRLEYGSGEIDCE